ncbi:MAG: ester cyclase [Actinomycetia bacterium]|nr:ester cyclase [Actinomycetes bacterium]
MSDHAITIAAAVDKLNAADAEGYVSTLYREDADFHGFPPDVPPDRNGITAFYRALVAGLPDLHVGLEDLLIDGDRVAVRFILTGTHTGELLGTSPTGNHLEVGAVTILRFDGDKVAERWNRLDDVALLTQIGAMPAAAAS